MYLKVCCSHEVTGRALVGHTRQERKFQYQVYLMEQIFVIDQGSILKT